MTILHHADHDEEQVNLDVHSFVLLTAREQLPCAATLIILFSFTIPTALRSLY